MSRFTAIDLFAGIGGFRTAVEANDGKCIGFSEIEPTAISVYLNNYHADVSENYGDITKIKALPEHDLLTGGVPCQSWSIAGKNLGFDDDRGKLWNDAIYLLKQSQPKAFIFENVKGLVDPRNADAFKYIMTKIQEAGYHASYHLLNSSDYGVPQSRVRVYIIGFKQKKYMDAFSLPDMVATPNLEQFLDDKCDLITIRSDKASQSSQKLSNQKSGSTSLSSNQNGFNDYFLFNDIRNGNTTLHTWDIVETTEKEKNICLLLLKNRRKSEYGPLDGNPLSLSQFQQLDASITFADLNGLMEKGILKREPYRYGINRYSEDDLSDAEKIVLNNRCFDGIVSDYLLSMKQIRTMGFSISDTIRSLVNKKIIFCDEYRYDFKYTKISTGLFGVNRIFLPSSSFFPTLVASDSNDYVTDLKIDCNDIDKYRHAFINEVYNKKRYRKITKAEACRIQGFPDSFVLPDNRSKWMKLLGNSVSVPLIKLLVKAICKTGVFEDKDVADLGENKDTRKSKVASIPKQRSLFDLLNMLYV